MFQRLPCINVLLTSDLHTHQACRYSTIACLVIDSSAEIATVPHLYGKLYRNFLGPSTNHYHHHCSTNGHSATYSYYCCHVVPCQGGTTIPFTLFSLLFYHLHPSLKYECPFSHSYLHYYSEGGVLEALEFSHFFFLSLSSFTTHHVHPLVRVRKTV